MTRTRPRTFLASAAVIALLALAVAACGGGATAATRTSTSTPTATTASDQTATVRVANSSLGPILVDSQGRTLYLFTADVGARSACTTSACTAAWPPLQTTTEPTAGSGANQVLLGTTPRFESAPEVTYDGHPLYLYVGDRKPGDVNGQGVVAFGAAWYVLSPGGQQITSQLTNRSTATTSGY